jgi:lysophospholipase
MELVATPTNWVPSGGEVIRVTTSDAVGLRAARWRPGRRRSKGSVLLLQGRAEFIEKYFEVIAELRRRGFTVVTFDWRGQGGSDRLLSNPRKGHVKSFSDYDRDLEAVIAQVMAEQAPQPWFSLAHSMGAAVLLHALHRKPHLVSRAVLSAPMIDIARVTAPRSAGVLSGLLNRSGMGRAFVPGGGATAVTTKPFESNPVTRDAKRYARNAAVIEADPRLGLGDPTIGWVNAAYRAMAPFADANFPLQVTTPLLCVAGSADQVTSTPAMERFAARLKTGRALVLTGAQHEILMEREAIRELFWAAFDAFIPGSESVAAAPPASALEQV